MTSTDHNKILSILFFIKGGIVAVVAILFVLVYGLSGLAVGGAMLAAGKGEEKLVGAGIGGAFVVFAVVLGAILLSIAGIYLMAGWKMHKHQQSAKTWATVARVFSFLNFPIGTALSVYALWFFYGDEGKRLYSPGYADNAHQQPPPHNWQQ